PGASGSDRRIHVRAGLPDFLWSEPRPSRFEQSAFVAVPQRRAAPCSGYPAAGLSGGISTVHFGDSRQFRPFLREPGILLLVHLYPLLVHLHLLLVHLCPLLLFFDPLLLSFPPLLLSFPPLLPPFPDEVDSL